MLVGQLLRLQLAALHLDDKLVGVNLLLSVMMILADLIGFCSGVG